MARKHKRRGFGSPSAVHLKEATKALRLTRVESGVVRQHLAHGQCAAAVRGLAYASWAFGKAAAHRQSMSLKRQAKGRHTLQPIPRLSGQMRKLADRVIKTCLR